MPYLIELNEWRLLQALGLLLSQRKARYQVQRSPLNSHRGGHLAAELLEVELRQVFTAREYPGDLDPADFEQCQAKLSSLCTLLNDDLSWPRSDNDGPHGQAYPRLQALTGSLERTTAPVDLVIGPNQTIFRLPQDATKLGKCLDVATECNNTLARLLESPPQEPTAPSAPTSQSKTAWKKARIRNRATFVLGRLFEHFRCETPHEVLLKLIEDPDEHSALPGLQLMLSPCRELELWQEARCDSTNLRETAISAIRDICTDLRQHAGEGKALMLLIEKYGLFGAWAGTATPGPAQSRQSLDQLILKGAFKPLDLDTLFNGASPARFSIGDKRALAVKLGFCLMDFFDVDVTPNKIYFLDSSAPGPKNDFPYLAFGSKLPAEADSRNNFEVGHPALLSFAKLLLEIDFGQSINLDIKPHNSQNRGVWAELLARVDVLVQERSDSYLQAIRGCLVVHEKIAKALRSRSNQSKEAADSVIRKKIYKEVIRKLERGLAESIPRPAHKRQRSESPTPSGHWDAAQQAVGLGKMAIRSMMPGQAASEHKKRRMFKAQMSSAPSISKSSLPSDSSSLREGYSSTDNDSEACKITRRLSEWHHSSKSITQHRSVSPSSVTTSSQRPLRREDFEVAFICALPLEYDAVSYLLDESWDENGDAYGRASGDPNHYTTGRMGNYSVVLALLPNMGKVNAASAAASMRSSYNGLRLAFVVGVCGAAPLNKTDEILLGDVIVSKTVMQHDMGRQYPNKFIRKDTIDDSLGRPNKDVRNLVRIFETDRGIDGLEKRTAYFLQQLQNSLVHTRRRGKYNHPGIAKDRLFKAEYRHKHRLSPACACCDCIIDADPVCDQAPDLSCADLGCEDEHLVSRDRLRAIRQQAEYNDKGTEAAPPAVHVGAVASGDTVVKSAAHRDRLASAGVIAFEMESAGVWDEMPSILVKGVCDYADSHKNKAWQDFAAATAASACKAILERYIRTDKPIDASFGDNMYRPI